jgi:hypothetical protein
MVVIKAPSTMEFSPALFKKLWDDLAARGKKRKPSFRVRIRNTFGGVHTAPQRSAAHPTGKRKATDLAS